MKLIKSKNYDVNYLAKIVNITSFEKHPDPEVTRLKIAVIDGFKVIMGIDSNPGLYIYFPALSEINPDFLRYANLYRDSTLNADDSKKGYFENNGKVSAIKLRGVVSEGFIIEADILNNWIVSSVNKDINFESGIEFDSAEHEGKEFWINKKYVKSINNHTGRGSNPRDKHLKRFDKIISNQFRFHYDTVLIRKCPNVINPNDLISITEKIHGTSGISAYVLCKWEPSLGDKIVNFINNKILRLEPIDFNDYDYIYSSRSVIKNQYYNKNVTAGFYDCDVWAEADKYVRPYLQKGMTFYYEIIGFLPTGSPIQKLGKSYDYGCVPPTKDEEYTPEKHFKVRIYRITLTNVDGYVHEFSAKEVQDYCKQVGLIPVTELYYGFAKDLYPELSILEHWNENFLDKLANDKKFYMEQKSPTCNNDVPHEGIVIKKETGRSEAWKLKCFAFLKGEIADDNSNIEDEA